MQNSPVAHRLEQLSKVHKGNGRLVVGSIPIWSIFK